MKSIQVFKMESVEGEFFKIIEKLANNAVQQATGEVG